MSEKEIDAMVYNKHLEIIKGVVAPAIMTENYLQAYREGIKDTIQKMMKEAVDTEVYSFNGAATVKWNCIIPHFYNVKSGDKVKLVIIKEDGR